MKNILQREKSKSNKVEFFLSTQKGANNKM